MSAIDQLRKGSTDLLILSVLTEGKWYGYQIMRELENRSEGYFTMTAALLYPALHQLEQDELITGEWEESQGKRRRKYYSITLKGQHALIENRANWQEFVGRLLKTLQFSRSVSKEN